MYRLLFIIMIFSIRSVGQSALEKLDETQFIRLSFNSGLMDNSVRYLAQDDIGYIWAATENGLSRYNGSKFQSFTNEANPDILAGNYVRKLKFLGKNKFGIITRSGFSILDTKTMKASLYLLQDSLMGDYANTPFDAHFIGDSLLALTTGTGFYIFDKDKRIVFQYNAFKKQDIGNTRIYFGQDIIQASKNELLVFVQDGRLFHFDISRFEFEEIKRENPGKWSKLFPHQTGYTSKRKISEKEFLFLNGGNKSVKYINLNTLEVVESSIPSAIAKEFWWESEIEAFKNDYSISCLNNGYYTFRLEKNKQVVFDPVKKLPHHRIYHVYNDVNGRLWIGTDKGLLMEKDQAKFVESFEIKSQIAKDKNLFIKTMVMMGNKLVLGMLNGFSAIIIYDWDKKKIIKEIEFFKGKADINQINYMSKVNSEELLISSHGGLFLFNINTYKMAALDDSYYDISLPINEHPKYIHFVNLGSGKIFRLDKTNKTVLHYPDSLNRYGKFKHFMAYGDSGDLWMTDYNLAKLDDNGNVSLVSDEKLISKDERFLGIAPGSNNDLWMGNVKGEIINYNIANKISKRYKVSSNNSGVFIISFPINNKIYFAVNNKFFSLDIQCQEVQDLTRFEFFPEERTTSKNYIFDSVSQKLVIGTTNHVVSLNTNLKNEINCNFFINSMSCGRDKIFFHPDTILTIPYNNEVLEIETSQLTYTTLPQTTYYKLDNGNWQEYKDEFRFNQLSFGIHTLEIKSNSLVYLSTSKKYRLYLKPPFYKSNWFFILSTLLLVSFVGYALKRRINNIRNFANLNQLIAESEMKALHAQMNPHFIFNSLNSIKGLILDENSNDASKYLSTFSDLIRKNLQQSRKNFISVQEQIDYIKQYLFMENLRFEELKYDIIIDSNLDLISDLMPPMIVQPLVENAIWHGFNQDTKLHFIKIEILSFENNKIICKIEDFGNGINNAQINKKTEGNSLALENIKQRIKLYNEKYKINCSLVVFDKSEIDAGNGTIAILTFNQTQDEI